MRYPLLLIFLLAIFARCAFAQSCNPAAVYYLVRDEKGQTLSSADLNSVVKQLPDHIGDANIQSDEVSFTQDKQTYYWFEDANAEKGSKVPALLFVNSATCTMRLSEAEISYHGKKMRLIFNIDINRTQEDRRPVIDAPSFQEGTFRLDLTNWNHVRDKMIPATYWKREDK